MDDPRREASDYGLTINSGIQQVAETARRAEAAGFTRFWVSETSNDAFLSAFAALQATESIQVGTNIALAFPRSPTITAIAAWDLAGLSGGRFMPGLGSQVRRIIEERYSAEFSQPAARMAEYIKAMRTAWAMEQGERAGFEGDFYTVKRPSVQGFGSDFDREPPPIFLAAVGPVMTAVATAHADGMLGHPLTSMEYGRSHLFPTVERGLEAAGRSLNDFDIDQGVIVSVAEDREVARREARRQIGFYGSTPNYARIFEASGDADLATELNDCWRRSGGDAEKLERAVPDEVVDKYAVAGTAADVREGLAALRKTFTRLSISPVWFQVSEERGLELLTQIIDLFAGG